MRYILEGAKYSSIVNFRNQISSAPENISLEISFENIDFVKPAVLVIIACIVEELSNKGTKVFFTNMNYKLCHYLNNINFFNYWEEGFNRDFNTKARNKTTLSLWHINKEMIFNYSTFAQNYYESIFFKGKSLDHLHINLSEVFNNIFDHSKSKISGYVLTQYYPNLNKIVTAVCDFGIGIPENINLYNISQGQTFLSDEKAIELAFKKGFSSKSQSHNLGFGLDNVNSIIKESNGLIKIISKNGYLLGNKNGIKTFNIVDCFDGTLIIIELDTNTFELKEDSHKDLFDL